jgi:hypothetical protein
MMLAMGPHARFCSDACRQKARRAGQGLKVGKDSSNEQSAEDKEKRGETTSMSKRKLEIEDAGGAVDLTRWQIGKALGFPVRQSNAREGSRLLRQRMDRLLCGGGIAPPFGSSWAGFLHKTPLVCPLCTEPLSIAETSQLTNHSFCGMVPQQW